jgi:GR25 family glycosyltransferase involved in LPS biosynthesis
MLKGIDVIYWINLERAKTRRADMEAMFRDSAFEGIPINRISAFDYKKTDTMSHFTLQKSDYKSTIPEYANFLSHMETIRGFSNSDYGDDSVALIMEDDITLE